MLHPNPDHQLSSPHGISYLPQSQVGEFLCIERTLLGLREPVLAGIVRRFGLKAANPAWIISLYLPFDLSTSN
jgi:hypothetical protein